MSKSLFFLGEPCQFKQGIKVYPPTVKEVLSNSNYALYLRLLTYSQEEVEDELLEATKGEAKDCPTPWLYLLGNSYHNKNYEHQCKEAFRFFLHQEVFFLYEPKLVVVGNIEEVLNKTKKVEDLITLGEEEFFDFQNLIRECVGQKVVVPIDPNEHPKVKEMKRKARYRDRIKAKQAAKDPNGISQFTVLVSICCMGLGITPLNIGEMSYLALQSIVRKYQDKEKYQLDIDSLLAGADSKKVKPQYWIKNFEE